MKKYLVPLFLSMTFGAFSQQPYWQQSLSYNINAELNDKDKTITGQESIVYKNNSPSTLDFIWFHIWPNAYKNESTALFQQLKNDSARAKKLENPGKGYIEKLAFTVNGKAAKTEPHSNPNYIDIIKVVLDKPLAPGDSITIATPFSVLLPHYFSRSGWDETKFMACQWYPKPAVYDKNGWHEMPYLDMGEFYSEYATYDVTLKVPSDYIVGATGILQTKAEIESYKKLGAQNTKDRKGKPALYRSTVTTPTKTLQYHAEQVPDFAWFADKDFVIQYDTVQLSSGKVIDAFSYYHNKPNTIWDSSIDYVKDGVRYYSEWIGEYGYPVAQAVEGPANNSSGGMEYPMVTLITSPNAKKEGLAGVIVHEVGHNWFMAMLGSNERLHTWMDEGLNTYYQFRYEAEKFKYNSIFGDDIPGELKKLPAAEFLGVIYDVFNNNLPMEKAMETPAEKFITSDEYGIVSYIKTALWMYMLESAVGREKVDAALQNYFSKWKFKHPEPEDMKKAFEEAIGSDLTKFFALTKKEGKMQ